MPDHVHMLVSIRQDQRQVHGISERQKFLDDFDKHGNLKYKFGNRNFGQKGIM